MNARIACSYVRWEQAEVKLFSAAVFDCSKSGSFRIDFGDRLRFAERVFAIVAALQRRNDSLITIRFRGQLPVSGDQSEQRRGNVSFCITSGLAMTHEGAVGPNSVLLDGKGEKDVLSFSR
jgi:hypothetical protein